MSERVTPSHVSRDATTDSQPLQRVRDLGELSRVGSYKVNGKLTERSHTVLLNATSRDGLAVVAKVSRVGIGDAAEENNPSPLLVTHETDVHKAVAKLGDPHILPLIDAGTEEIMVENAFDEYPYIVTELASQGTLDQALRDGPLDPHVATEVLHDVGAVVDTLHRRGIRHRDIKPANVFLGKNGAMVGDFGSAIDGNDIPAEGGGSVGFMAPEMKIKGGVSPELRDRVDVFSVAAMAYKMFAGKEPFPSADQQAYEDIFDPERYQHVLDTKLSVLPRPLQEPIGRALSLAPEVRHETAEAFVSEVDEGLRRVPKSIVLYRRPMVFDMHSQPRVAS